MEHESVPNTAKLLNYRKIEVRTILEVAKGRGIAQGWFRCFYETLIMHTIYVRHAHLSKRNPGWL